MSTISNGQQDSTLILDGFISTGRGILQNLNEIKKKIASPNLENSVSQFFLETAPKINKFHDKLIRSNRYQIGNVNSKLIELMSIIKELTNYPFQVQKTSRIFIDSILTNMYDIQLGGSSLESQPLDFNSFIEVGNSLIQKYKESFKNILCLDLDESFSQFFLDIEPKINEFYKAVQDKKVKIIDGQKLAELISIMTELTAYPSQVQQISKIFIDTVLTKVEDLQCIQQILDLTTDSEKAQIYLDRGRTYFNKDKFDKAVFACSQAIALKGDLEEAYLYRKASLDALSSEERKKVLLNIAKTTCNFQLCELHNEDIDDIIETLMTKYNESFTLNICHNWLTEKSAEKLLGFAKKNPYVIQIEYTSGTVFTKVSQELNNTLQENRNWYSTEKGKRFNIDFFVAYREGKSQLKKATSKKL